MRQEQINLLKQFLPNCKRDTMSRVTQALLSEESLITGNIVPLRVGAIISRLSAIVNCFFISVLVLIKHCSPNYGL